MARAHGSSASPLPNHEDRVRQAKGISEQSDAATPDGSFAYRKTLRSENAALAEYQRVLTIFCDLTVNRRPESLIRARSRTHSPPSDRLPPGCGQMGRC